MNVYPIFLSLYIIMTMRVRVGRIEYRVSDKPSKVPPSASPARSFAHQHKTRRNPRAPGSRRSVERILFRLDFGISAGAPETDEARNEKTREKRNKKRATFRDGEPTGEGRALSRSRRQRPWMISPSEIWSTPVKRVDQTSNVPLPLFSSSSSYPSLPPASPLPSFVQVVGRWLEVRLSRWTERRWRGGRSGSDLVYQGIVGRRARRRGRSNSESVRTIIWRWQRDGQDERSTSPSTLTSSRRSFSFFVSARLR